MPPEQADGGRELPGEVIAQLQARGIDAHDEVALRRALEERAAGYSLYRLTPAAVHK